MTERLLSSLLFICFFTGCSKPPSLEPAPKAYCGEIVRMYSQNTSSEDGNPCGNNPDVSRQFAFIVSNEITGNEKTFCINISVFTDYSVGNRYCDIYIQESW